MIAFNALGPVNDSICSVINDSVIHCPSPSVKKEWQAKSAELGAELDELRLGISVSFSPVPSSSSPLHAPSSLTHHHSHNSNSGNFNSNSDISNSNSHSNNNLQLPPQQRVSPLSSSSIRFHSNHFSSAPSSFIPSGPIKWSIKYLPDPVAFFQLGSDEGIKLYTGDPLVIEGDNLKLAATEDEVTVTVGSALCNLTTFTMRQLVCLPPSHSLAMANFEEDESPPSLPEVIVHIGSNLHFKIGYLKYNVREVADDMSHLVYLASAAIVGALVVVILVAVTTFRRKSTSHRNHRHSGPGGYLFSSPDALARATHHQYDLSDTSKLPVPLITSSVVKPLPLIPSPAKSGTAGCGTSDLSTPTDSAVNAIYSEISELNISQGEQQQSPGQGGGAFSSRLNQLSVDNKSVMNTGRIHQSSVTASPYPPFYTFNTIGRSKNRSNPYIFHDSMAPVIRPVQGTLDCNLVNGSSSSPLVPASSTSSSSSSNSTSSSASPASAALPSSNTYAVYAFNKFNRANSVTGSASVVIGRGSKMHAGSPGSKDRFV